MMQTRTADFAKSSLFRSLKSTARTWWGGALFGVAAVLIAVGLRTALQTIGQFYYLPMMAAVMATALFAHRLATVVVITLSVAASLLLMHRQNSVDALANAALFVLVAVFMAEVCHRLTAALSQSRALSSALSKRGSLLDTLLTSAPILTLDKQGRIHRVTPAAAELMGVGPADLVDRPLADLMPDFDMEALNAATDGGALPLPSAGYWSIQTPAGEVVPLTLHANILPEDVAPEHVVLSLGDQRQALATRERTRDLTNQLSSVWRLNSMGEMAATLAHELNQPLTAATVYLHAGRTDITRAGPIGDSAGRAIDLAKTQLLRAGDIIRRMRELIATGAQSFANERMSSMVDDLSPIFDLIGRDTGVTIRIDVQSDGDQVQADRIQFQQAIANLVRNAVDAVSGQDDAVVTITGRHTNQGYEIRVEDNGPGIPDDQMDHIFQPMTTTKTGGMGLGLSVTRSIVESHNATLVVGRSPLGGAAFSFRLSHATELEAA